MKIRKLTLCLGLAMALGASGTGVALAQGMPESQPVQGGDMMRGGMGQGGMGQGGMGLSMMGGGMMPCPMMDTTGMNMMQSMLEPGQRDEMRELMQEHRPAQLERMGRFMNMRDDLMAEMHGERPDPEQVKTLHSELAELHGEMMIEMVRMRNTMHDLITDDR
ncbi:hypothetical protein [Vreelandella alkaliphila]|uniref:hypothetical protein n=1 Tax=Vreelandella alkaliphila TaxID=272774 RepID=UPI00197ACE71|nr:hypothetical protein [Halomonas alkaliphila]